ncbi:hypothetical protein D1AOALGA4SA_4272 [Olavius algarvensis Delta 1 endosymbiont]|nr:hypothetical protein D1AOALGA4SA_4272 [Olavius algarvensis Delta 1 endosymbiont]
MAYFLYWQPCCSLWACPCSILHFTAIQRSTIQTQTILPLMNMNTTTMLPV